MREKPPESHNNKSHPATQGGEIKRKLDAARARCIRLNKQMQTYRGENGTNKASVAREALKKLQDEIMWLEIQLQALEAGIGMFRVEPREADPNKLMRLSIKIQEEAQRRVSQFQAELEKLEDEARRIRSLYLGVISKMGELLREANRTTILLEKVQGYIPNDRLNWTDLWSHCRKYRNKWKGQMPCPDQDRGILCSESTEPPARGSSEGMSHEVEIVVRRGLAL
jgi:chromosome segregation ATPase